MDVTAEDFRRHYESLSDEALLEIDTTELVQTARTCHADELARRGIETSVASPADDTDSAAAGSAETVSHAEPEELVCIAEYDYMDEADLARGLLEAAEFPVSLESEPGVVRLMVPAALAEQALATLVAPLSDEELEAQAEAAGHPDGFDESEEPDEEPEVNPEVHPE